MFQTAKNSDWITREKETFYHPFKQPEIIISVISDARTCEPFDEMKAAKPTARYAGCWFTKIILNSQIPC